MGANHEGMMGLINIPRSMYDHVPKIGCVKKETNTILGLTYISGWWYTYPSEKYESQLGLLFP